MAIYKVILEDTAWNLIGHEGLVRIKGGRSIYEDVGYQDSTPGDHVRLARLEDAGDMRLRQVNRYIPHDTILEVLEEVTDPPVDDFTFPGFKLNNGRMAMRPKGETWEWWTLFTPAGPLHVHNREGAWCYVTSLSRPIRSVRQYETKADAFAAGRVRMLGLLSDAIAALRPQ